jgi:hypothetical protein
MEAAGQFVEMFGWKFVLLLAALAVAFFVLVWLPLWWPAWRARRQHLPRPWLFAFVVAGLAYGFWTLLSLAVILPTGIYEVFFAPQFREWGHWQNDTLDDVLRWIVEYWWLAVVPLQVLVTLLLTRWLSRRWPGVCRGLAEAPPANS